MQSSSAFSRLAHWLGNILQVREILRSLWLQFVNTLNISPFFSHLLCGPCGEEAHRQGVCPACQVRHIHSSRSTYCTVSKRFLILRTWSLIRTFLVFWVLIHISGSLFSISFTHKMSIQSACIQQWFRFKLLENFDFYLWLCNNFHTSSFWVLILAAGGPYWVLFSQKMGPYWVLISKLGGLY